MYLNYYILIYNHHFHQNQLLLFQNVVSLYNNFIKLKFFKSKILIMDPFSETLAIYFDLLDTL